MTFREPGHAWLAYGILLGAPGLAMANPHQFDMPAEPLLSALKTFATQAHMQLFYEHSVVAGAQGNAVRGRMESREALSWLLRDTGLEAVYSSDTEATIQPARARRASSATPAADESLGGNGAAKGSDAGVSKPAAASAGDTSLQEVIVTAQKSEQRLMDVPIPVSAISAASVATQNQFRLEDYYSQVPGLSLTPNEFGGVPTIAIRGVTSGDFTNPVVGITVDGIAFGPSTSIGGGFAAPDLDPSDLARIEVLRGPQGTLYGASSIGGLVNYVTVDPSTSAFSGRVEAGLSQVHNGPNVGYNLSAAVNVPVSDTLSVRLSGFFRTNPGYIENIRSGKRGINTVEADGAHFAALWSPSSSFSLKLSAFFQDNRLFASPFVTLGDGIGDLHQDFLPGTGAARHKLQAYSAIATAKLGTSTLTSVTSFSVSQFNDNYDYTAVDGPLTALAFPTENTTLTDNTHTSKVSQEIRLNTPLGRYFDWLLGGFYTHEYSPWALDLTAVTPTTQPIGSFGYTVFASVYAEEAAFTDLTYHATDSLDIQFGGRESQIRQTFWEKDYGLYATVAEGAQTPPFVVPEQEAREHAFTYLVTPKLKISPNLMVYVRLASGYGAGGINQGHLPGEPSQFEPDRTYNYELGAKGTAFDRRLSFDASVYYISWKQIQLSMSNPANGQSYFANGSAAKSEGVELSVQGSPVSGLRLGGWVAYDDAALTQDLPANSTVYGIAGARLPYSSRFSANGTVDYTFPMGAFSATVGAAVSYVGDRVGQFGTLPARQGLPGYAKTDLHASVQPGEWTFSAYINNVMDRRGLTGGGIGTVFPNQFGVIQPRTIGISVARAF